MLYKSRKYCSKTRTGSIKCNVNHLRSATPAEIAIYLALQAPKEIHNSSLCVSIEERVGINVEIIEARDWRRRSGDLLCLIAVPKVLVQEGGKACDSHARHCRSS